MRRHALTPVDLAAPPHLRPGPTYDCRNDARLTEPMRLLLGLVISAGHPSLHAFVGAHRGEHLDRKLIARAVKYGERIPRSQVTKIVRVLAADGVPATSLSPVVISRIFAHIDETAAVERPFRGEVDETEAALGFGDDDPADEEDDAP